MADILHLSMRVPWRDRPWDEFVCDDPLGNSSCTLLTAIGKHRDDAFEEANSGARIDGLDQNWLSCLSERATFMSRLGYSVVKKHPYRNNPAMRGKIHDTAVTLPGYAFEAVPFRWLNRKSFGQEVGHDRVPQFNPLAEDAADRALNYAPPWVMDGDNQLAIMSAFFELSRSIIRFGLDLGFCATDRLLVRWQDVTECGVSAWSPGARCARDGGPQRQRFDGRGSGVAAPEFSAASPARLCPL